MKRKVTKIVIRKVYVWIGGKLKSYYMSKGG